MSASEKLSGAPGRERKEDEARPVGNLPDEGQQVPLFLRDTSDARKGDAQDEKDSVGE